MIDTNKLARLAKLEIPADIREDLTRDLERMIEFASRLGSADDTFEPYSQQSVLREDIPAPSVERQRLLECAPRHTDGYFVLPRVIGEEE